MAHRLVAAREHLRARVLQANESGWFLKMLRKRGIAERRTQVVNWDPVDHTVLAQRAGDPRPRPGARARLDPEARIDPLGHHLYINLKYAEGVAVQVNLTRPPLAKRVKLMQEDWIG